jgi:hypothetical protein
MKFRYHEIEDILLPNLHATGCINPIEVKDVDFPVSCGKCLPCQQKRRSDWSFRLEQEYLSSDSAFFITLTYNDLNLPFVYRKSYQKIVQPKEIVSYKVNGKPVYKKEQKFKLQYSSKSTLNKKHLQDYIKQLRNKNSKYIADQMGVSLKKVKTISKPLRYYAVGEYGKPENTHRPHYHILLFNYEIGDLTPISDSWQKGQVDIGTVTTSSINYCTKYINKTFDRKNDKRQAPFSIMSKGRQKTPYGIIGYNYLNKFSKHHIISEDLTVRNLEGNIARLPKAFLQRIFPDKEERRRISDKSFIEHEQKKIKEYKRQLQFYKSPIEYAKSKENDIKRKKTKIINETTI